MHAKLDESMKKLDEMCFFAFFWLLKICIVDLLIANHMEKIKMKTIQNRFRYMHRVRYLRLRTLALV